MSRIRSTAVALSGVTLVAVLAAGCSSSGSGSPAASPATGAGSATGSPIRATSTSAQPTTTVTRSVGTSRPASLVGPCLESQLRASIDPRHIPGNGTAGTDGRNRHAVLVDFRNISSRTCTLYGYPGAAIETASNQQVQQATRTLNGSLAGTGRLQTVTLRPGAYAAAFLEGHDIRERGAAQAGCDAPKYPRILVTPPNTDTPVPFTAGWPVCYSFDVHPVRALTTPPQ